MLNTVASLCMSTPVFLMKQTQTQHGVADWPQVAFLYRLVYEVIKVLLLQI